MYLTTLECESRCMQPKPMNDFQSRVFVDAYTVPAKNSLFVQYDFVSTGEQLRILRFWELLQKRCYAVTNN